MGRGWLPFVLLALVSVAAAVQPLARVDQDVLYLPGDGIALSARDGSVLWRFPRLDGQIYTNGHGLLMVSWLAVVNHPLHVRFTRICRLDTHTGHQLWCRNEPNLQQWTVDSGGRRWYAHVPGRLVVLDTGDGQPDTGFKLHHDANLSLMPLPKTGALLLDRSRSRTQALVYHTGAAALAAEDLPSSVYAFRGDGRGLVLYAQKKGQFFLADPLIALWHRVQSASIAHPFPVASLDQHGFVFTDWQGSNPVVRGGTYDGAVWQAPRQAPGGNASKLALGATTALMLHLSLNHHDTELQAWNLDSGAPRYRLTFDHQFPLLICRGNDLVLKADDVRLLDAATGAQRWDMPHHFGALAAIANSAIVFWDGNGILIGLARQDGHPLWRIQFRQPGLG